MRTRGPAARDRTPRWPPDRRGPGPRRRSPAPARARSVSAFPWGSVAFRGLVIEGRRFLRRCFWRAAAQDPGRTLRRYWVGGQPQTRWKAALKRLSEPKPELSATSSTLASVVASRRWAWEIRSWVRYSSRVVPKVL